MRSTLRHTDVATRPRSHRAGRGLGSAVAVPLAALLLSGCGGGRSAAVPDLTRNEGGIEMPAEYGRAAYPYVVLAYNDLGMHCTNRDFSRLMVLPPANTMHAQVIRRANEPKITTSGLTVTYSVPGNTRSADKTNFWAFAPALLGVSLPPNIGLTGKGLSGAMVPSTETREWVASAIPVTPMTDAGEENPYQLATITALSGSTVVGKTQAVIPVSWEMNCNLCHRAPAGGTVEDDILADHDRLHHTTLSKQKPVLCGSCHAQAPLGLAGKTGVPSQSLAMHGAHASRMSQSGRSNPCYACHPGVRTQCQRDVHSTKGMTCVSCHQSMTAVASATRRPWVDLPRCGNCHRRSGFAFEQTGKLFRESYGHHRVRCEACHGSPHAIIPTTVAADNLQAIAYQGSAGPIRQCTVCHTRQPNEKFEHHG